MWAIKAIDLPTRKKQSANNRKPIKMKQIEDEKVGPRAKPKKLKNENYLFEKVRPVCC